MNYSNRRKPSGDMPRRGLRVVIIMAAIAVLITVSVIVISTRLGPFPFGISRRDTTLLTLWNAGDYNEVLTEAQAILRERPLDGQALTFAGFALFYVGIDLAAPAEQQANLQDAIVLLRKAEHVDSAPLPNQRRYVLAKAYYHTGGQNLDLAARYMELALDGGYAAEDSYSYLGLANERRGDLNAAASWYERGLESSDTAALRLKAAEARSLLGDLDQAQVHLESALESTEDEFLAVMLEVRLSSVLIEQGELERAEQMLDRLIEDHPDSADARYYLGVVYSRTERAIEARDMWRAARDIDPNHAKALESLANREG